MICCCSRKAADRWPRRHLNAQEGPARTWPQPLRLAQLDTFGHLKRPSRYLGGRFFAEMPAFFAHCAQDFGAKSAF